MNAIRARPVIAGKRFQWKWLFVGLAVRLGGVGLLWLGDGHDDLFHKMPVVLGAILSIGGIGVLRYLLLVGLLSKRGKAERAG